MTQPVVFISYSRRDEAEKDALVSHLGVLHRTGLIYLWSDDRIGAGENWHIQMHRAMDQAKIAVLLITANFLNSEFILDMEVPALLHRHQNAGLMVYPVLARACAWRSVKWLRGMAVRPKNSVPVWSDGGAHVDEDLSTIAEDISMLVAAQTPIAGYKLALPQKFRNCKPIPVTSWRILVVEDEPSWQKRLSRILHEINCTVVTAGNYEQAENLLDDFNFDLVTVDLNLDKATQYADGLELVLRIREVSGQRVPVIVVTGTGKLEEQRRAFKEYGVFDFIQKAKLDYEEFQAIVQDAINRSTD